MKIAIMGEGAEIEAIKFLLKKNKISFIDLKFSNPTHDFRKLEEIFLIFLGLPAHEIRI